MKMNFTGPVVLTLGFLLAAQMSRAQFVPGLLQNASYWRDGKSEVDFYGADLVRDGQHYQTEVFLVLTAEFVDPNLLTRIDDPKRPGALPVIRMHQETAFPRGLLLEELSIDAIWRMDFMSLAQLRLTGSDGIGPIAKSVNENRTGQTVTWKCSCDTYSTKAEKTVPAPNGIVLFYDELPLRVRTIDFSKPNGSFEVQLTRSVPAAKENEPGFKPATISYKISERAIEVQLKQDTALDEFVLDRDFPFLLREWKVPDGSHWKLKNSIKAEPTRYTKPGDRERAFKDPMLRHPD